MIGRAARTALLGVAAVTAVPAAAADAGGNYAVWGAGGRSCNQYQRSATETSARAPFRDYLMGYLTAYNALAPDTYNALGEMSLDDATNWLDRYCDAHKLDSFDRAVAQLMLARHGERTRGGGGGGWGRAIAPGGGTARP